MPATNCTCDLQPGRGLGKSPNPVPAEGFSRAGLIFVFIAETTHGYRLRLAWFSAY